MFSSYLTSCCSATLLLVTISTYVSDTVYCDSYKCPYGYALIDDADHEECKYGKCEKSKCCDKVCSSVDYPKHYKLKNGYDKIKCDYSGCTTDKCCKYHCESPLPADYTLFRLKYRRQHRRFEKRDCMMVDSSLLHTLFPSTRPHRSFADACLWNSATNTAND